MSHFSSFRRQQISSCLFRALIILPLCFISGCNSGTKSDPASGSSETASATFTIAWHGTADPRQSDKTLVAAKSVYVPCDLVDYIDCIVYDAAGIDLASETFACTAHQGTIDNIPVGTDRVVAILGVDAGGDILYHGEIPGVTIEAGQTNDLGVIDVYYPFFVELISPADGASVAAGELSFQWTAVEDAYEYNIVIATDSGFAAVILDTLTAGTTFTPSVPLDPGSYYWMIRPVDAYSNYGPESEAWEFTAIPDDTVNIPDSSLEAVIRDEIEKPTGEITKTDMEGITSLTSEKLEVTDIASLEGLQYCSNLTYLWLCYNQIGDLGPLEELTQLDELWFYDNNISDIAPLENLTNLTVLNLSYNEGIDDISPIADMTKLERFSCQYDQVSDIGPLADKENLHALWLEGNLIEDIQVLVDNGNDYTYLNLKDNPLSETACLSHIPILVCRCEELYHDCDITVLTPTSSFTARLIGDENVLVGDASEQEGQEFNSSFLAIKEGTSDRTCLEFDIYDDSPTDTVFLNFDLLQLDGISKVQMYYYYGNGLCNASDYYNENESRFIQTFIGETGLYSIDITDTYTSFYEYLHDDHSDYQFGILLKNSSTSDRYQLYFPTITIVGE